MSHFLDDDALNALFRQARTHTAWLDRPVEPELLHQLYALMKWGPTSANSCPARILFLTSVQAKERLKPALSPGNVGKTMKAPVTAILAFDLKFYDQMSRLAPQMPGARDMFAKQPPETVATAALRNGSLQGGYFILAARSLGLDCGPMSGFDNAKVDQEFFPEPARPIEAGGKFIESGAIKSNFLCNLGYGDAAELRPRAARLEFNEACQIL
jgi:3-hydroxypropanoate dehydrogenase